MTSAPEQASIPGRDARWARYTRWLSGRRGDALIGIALFTLLVVARTHGVSRTMWLLGDQIRDWTVALGPLSELPLAGPPSVAGGNALGPIYYWLLWLARVVIGPWFDNLPHAGAYGLALLHAAADVFFFVALRRYSQSSMLALAAVLLLATAPYDLALSSTIWSPPLAVSFVKVALGLFLLNAHHPSRWRMAATIAIAWFAVQTHSSTVLVFLPLAAWFVTRELAARRWRGALETARVIVEVVLVLQLPYIVDRLASQAPGGAPTMIVEGVKALVADPLSARPGFSFNAVTERIAYLWALPMDASWTPWLLALAGVCTLAAARRRPELLFAGLLPFAAAVIGFAAWTRPIETYWFLGLAPAAALMIVAGACMLPAGRRRDAAAFVWLAVVLYAQPSRIDKTVSIHRMPEYGALIDGTREIARRTHHIGRIRTAFALPETTDPAFPFVCMGGTVSRESAFEAVIAADGTVAFRERR